MTQWLFNIPMKGDSIRVRVRGIYATALTKFFIDNGFEITQPSQKLIERFNFENPSFMSPHIDIQTKGARAFVECIERYTEKFKKILLDEFEDIIIYQYPFAKNSIWKGVVTKKTKDGYIVRFSLNMEGFLPNNNASQQYQEGDLIIVEVHSYDQKNNKIILTDTISMPGEYIVLIKKEIVKVSRKIRGQRKIELLDLGNILRPPGWGAIFRTSAMHADIELISDEFTTLKEYAEKLLKTAKSAPAFTQIREGINLLVLYFPKQTKEKLDNIRSQVTPTIKQHHWLKTLGKTTSFLVDFVESNLHQLSPDLNSLSQMVLDFIKTNILPTKGQTIAIHHIKPNLKRVILGPAKIIEVKKENSAYEYFMFRRFSGGGYYDGINAPKESGDYGITIAKEGDTKLVTLYFDMNSNLKGIYVNINTPIEIYPKSIRYVDLEIDVVRTSEGDILIIDRQKLTKYYEQSSISPELYRFAQKKAEEYKTWLESGGQEQLLEIYEQLRESIEEELLE